MRQELHSNTEVLRRQVHPAQLQEDGEPARTAFTPTKEHGFELSTLRESVSPAEAHRRHVEAGRLSAGTWGIAVGEARDAECRAFDDADEVGVADHASIDFKNLAGRAARERAGRKIRDAAVKRGCLYSPVEGT